MKVEQRGRIRAKYDTTISITNGKETISTTSTCDISLNGIFILTKKRFALHDKCDLTLTLNSKVANLTLRLKCEVIRETNEGFAVTFEEMDIETYQHLKNIVLYNSDDPEAFLKQCQERPGFK